AAQHETARRGMGRPLARGAQSAQASAREERDAESALHASATGEELGHAPEPSGAAHANEERDDGSPPPHAASAQATATPTIPVAAATQAAVAKPALAPVPDGPQRLDARASIAELDVEGSLGTGIVSRMLARATPALKACYVEAAKRANRNDFASIQVNLIIDESGAVRQVTASHHPLGDLSACASSALKRMRSERVPDVGTVQVKFKLAFTP
ncbi:MAG: serine/threonine protein kinase, partial [Myxococcaceae bacterium]|nr:serine/threonine protein kinase [Myxococcaceae bacterium]